jgi:hypothetical protein
VIGSAEIPDTVGLSDAASDPERLLHRAALAVLGIQAAALTLLFWRWDFDDARIVYRVVDHLLHGQGWTYNSGERLNPSTSVLNTVLTAALGLVGFSRSLAAHLVGGASLFLTGYSLYGALSVRFAPAIALAVAGLALSVLGGSSTWGLETMLFTGLLCFVAHELVHGREPWVPLGLLILARPDGAVAAALVWLDVWRRERRVPARGALIVGGILLPWAVFSLFKFGQLFPSTLAAKIWQGQSGMWGRGSIYLAGLRARVAAAVDLDSVILAAVGMTLLPPQLRALHLIGAFALLQQGAYVVLNVPAYHWYFVLFDVWRWAFAALALVLIVPRLWSLPAWLARREVRLGGAGVVALAIVWMAVSPLADGYPRDHRDEVYAQVVREVDRLAPNARVLAALEVGTIGDLTRRRIVDLTGLTSANPEYLTGGHTDQFFARPADVVVLHEPPWHFERAIADDVRFSLLYRAAGGVKDPGLPMSIFTRNPASEGLDAVAFVREQHPSVTASSERAEPSPLARCVVDSLNGRSGTAVSRLRTKALLVAVRGWAVVSSWAALPPALTLRLQSDAAAYDLEVPRDARPDVASALSQPAFEQAGFTARAAITEVPPGNYNLLLGQRSAEGEMVWCEPGSELLVRR